MKPQAKRSRRTRVRKVTGREKLNLLASAPPIFPNGSEIQTTPSRAHWLHRFFHGQWGGERHIQGEGHA